MLESWDNRIYDIFKLERLDKKLHLVLRSTEVPTVSYDLDFRELSNFEYSRGSDQLPQSVIGLDYWHADTDKDDVFCWELNGDECTWNFHATWPKMSRSEDYPTNLTTLEADPHA